MEVASLFASSAGTAEAASAAASTIGPVTAAQSGAAAISSAFSLSSLATGLSLASAASDIFGGISQGKSSAAQLTAQAQQDLMNAKQTELAGEQQSNDIQQNLIQTIAAQRLAYSGAGIDFSFGTPAALETNLNKQAQIQFDTSRYNTQMQTLARRRAGYLSLSQVGQAQSAPVVGGLVSAGKTLAGRLS